MSSHVISCHLMSCHHLILIDYLRLLLLSFLLVVSSFFHLLSSISPLFSCLFCLLFSPFYLAFHLFSILLFCLVLVLVLVLVRCVALRLSSPFFPLYFNSDWQDLSRSAPLSFLSHKQNKGRSKHKTEAASEMNYQADHDVPPSSDDLLLLGSSYRTFFRTQALRRSHCCDRISSILRKSLCDVECDVGCDRSGNQTEAASQIFQAQGTDCHVPPPPLWWSRSSSPLLRARAHRICNIWGKRDVRCWIACQSYLLKVCYCFVI